MSRDVSRGILPGREAQDQLGSASIRIRHPNLLNILKLYVKVCQT